MSNWEEPDVGTRRNFLKRSRDESDSYQPRTMVKQERDPDGDNSKSPSLLHLGQEKETDVKPKVDGILESKVRNRADETQPPVPLAEITRSVPLMNFFKFDNPNVVQPVVHSLNFTARDVGAPPAKIPKKAHYNCHNLEEETKYVAENALQQEKAIPSHLANSDASEDESNFEEHRERYFKKHNVYTQFNFKYRKIDTSRLAACAKREMILQAIDENRVVIVEGFTGCGKTTQVPQFILDKYAAANRPCNIIVTQPRRIAAVSVAKRVCYERGWDVGSVVGYQVGMEKRTDRDSTVLTYVTTGVLLQKLIGARTVKDYTHIIIDEVHERDLESDLLLLVLKKILQDDETGKEKHVKLILMSATLNAQKFSAYFISQCNDLGDPIQSPIVKIPTNFRHRIDEYFLDHLLKDDLISKDKFEHVGNSLELEKAVIQDEVYDIALNLILSFDDVEAGNFAPDPRRRKEKLVAEKRGSVLVFLPGMEEINCLFKLLTAKNKERIAETRDPDEYKWDICPLHSSVTNEDQAKVFETPQKNRRKIILSTNIAESSVTVPDVVYVIDFCMTKSLCVDSRTNFTTLRLVWASISQCIQRKGRTGRVADGRVYRLVPKKFFSLLDQDTKPEMLRSNLETVILQLKKLNLGSPKELLALALDPPIISGIERAVANLKEYGALTILTTDPKTNQTPRVSRYDTCDGDCTFLGRVMTELPIPQHCSRLIMLGHCFGVLKESIIIAAALSVKNPFSTPFQKQLAAYLTKMNWSKKTYSDCFCLLFVYKNWMAKFSDAGEGQQQIRARENERRWARGEYIQLSTLREIKSTIELIEERLKQKLNVTAQPLVGDSSLDANLTKEQCLMLKMAIAGAFYPNYFHRHRPDMKIYEKECSKDVSGHDLFNTVYFRGFPPKHNGKLYAKHIAEYLSFGLTIPVIKFEGQKVLAVFDNRGDKIGPINKGLYRAVKKRQLRDNCEFDMIWIDKEVDELKHWQNCQDHRQFTKASPQIELPPILAHSLEVFITHMLTPSHFWIVYLPRLKYLNDMVHDINQELCHIPLPKRKIQPNSFCLAPHKDDALYYRGKILTVDPTGEALIYFVDYGNSSWTRTSVLMDFSPSMCEKRYDTYHALAVECRLAEIKPATVYGPVWHEDAVRRFHRLTDNKELQLEIYSVLQSVIIGTLKVKHPNISGEILSINKYLIDEGFGDYMPETYLSKMNHKIRDRADIIIRNESEVKAHNDDQIAESYDLNFMEPPSRGTVHASLKGPYSPLELKFQNLCASSSSKEVTIDNNSVNSVVLDFEPTAPTSRLLVASSVAIQDKSGRLVARDTTMMPAITGLMALTSMMFAPTIELRTDMRRSRYTGVLCGLGTSPHDADLPIYPDHDLEIIFDTEINDDDINRINNIRYLMNVILRQDGGRVNISHSHKALVKEIFSLLKKDRKRAEEEIWPQEEYVWNKLAPEFLKGPSKQAFDYRHLDIFLPHKTVVLNIEEDEDLAWGYDV